MSDIKWYSYKLNLPYDMFYLDQSDSMGGSTSLGYSMLLYPNGLEMYFDDNLYLAIL